MKLVKSLLLACVVIAALASESALADPHHRGHASIGVYVGPGFGPYYPRPRPYWVDPFYYPYPYYAYPPAVVVTPPPAPPPVYIEQAPQQQAPQTAASPDSTAGYWYHCSQPEGYYPYVKECPQGWKKVAPQPPSEQAK